MIKRTLGSIYRKVYKNGAEERAFRKRLNAEKGPIRLVVGSSGVFDEGWIPSEAHFLNLLDEKTWLNYFKEGQVDCILAEHVWEHLTPEEGKKAAQVCFKFLKKGGWIRVAVPDGFHKSPEYIEYVKPGGHGAGADDHKILYTYKTFSAAFEQAGFNVDLLEYFDENKEFHHNPWDPAKGLIRRSEKYDSRNANGELKYTSLIIDGIKE